MNPSNDRRITTLLFNPFVFIAGAEALFLGLGAILLAGWIGSWSGTHFDGVLDTHSSGLKVPVWVFLAEGIVDWLCLGVVLLLVGRLASKTSFRVIDIMGTQALARWPTVFFSLLLLPKGFHRFATYLVEQIGKPGGQLEFGADAVMFFAVVFAMIPLLCWLVLLMYKAYSVSCNLRGAKGIWTFIGGLILAEILSKIAIYGLLKLR